MTLRLEATFAIGLLGRQHRCRKYNYSNNIKTVCGN